MRRVLLVSAIVAVTLAIYARLLAQDQHLEFEFTVAEKAGLLNQAAPAPESHMVTQIFFRRSDGVSGYIVHETRNGRTATVAFYKDPQEKATVAVQVEGAMRTTIPVPPTVVRNWVSASIPSDCTGWFSGSQTMGEVELFGVKAQRLRFVTPAEEAEFYVAPSLDCATLTAHHKWKDKDGVFTSWTNVELLDLKLGPPNPKYFNLGADAREAPPSEARTQIHELLYPNEPCPDCLAKGARRRTPFITATGKWRLKVGHHRKRHLTNSGR